MNFFRGKPKINISTSNFYIILILISLLTLTNAIFFGISMSYKSIISDVVKYQSTYDVVKSKLIINYVAFSSIITIFGIHTYLARSRIKIGYFYTNIWNFLIAIIVAIPIIIQPNWDDPKIYINLGFYVLFAIVIFKVYRQIYSYRRITAYWIQNNGGGIPW